MENIPIDLSFLEKYSLLFAVWMNLCIFVAINSTVVMAQHNDIGKWGEQMAIDYLRHRGYTIRDCDWRYRHRDIDIVALTEDMRTIVFVEVKTRTSAAVATPDQAIDLAKVKSIGYAANAYIKQNRIMLDVRFDIVTIVGTMDEGIPQIQHLEDAFNPMLAY